MIVDRARLAYAQECRRTGRRVAGGRLSEDNLRRSRQRARTEVRRRCINIAADHLLTLTTREDENRPDNLLRVGRLLLCRYRKHLGRRSLAYVMVVEPHPSNPKHWHLHIALHGRVDVFWLRREWHAMVWRYCGVSPLVSAPGNVDARYIRGDYRRSARTVASYLSKYLTKIELHWFNKKTYWASAGSAPEMVHILLRAANLEALRTELLTKWGVDLAYLKSHGRLLEFDRGVFWFGHPEDPHPPPF